MPVWHEETKAARASGRLVVLGITQEQHPARCRLFAQWHGIDWPILWDPFNLTGSKVVPRFTLVDEDGVVRVSHAKPGHLAEFLADTFEAPTRRRAPPVDGDTLVAPGLDPGTPEARALADLMRAGTSAHDVAIETLARAARKADALEAARRFRLGVAHRLRYDSAGTRPDDFRRALQHWSGALVLTPDQYIWRRRIQQYGPRPDKPYPFYDWVDRARADIAARGETPVALPVPLTETERSAWREARGADVEPDPKGLVPRADATPVARVESAVAWSTGRQSRAARVHLRVHLTDVGRAAWNPEESLVGWVRDPAGGGWDIAGRRLLGTVRPALRDDKPATLPVDLEFEVTPPAEGKAVSLEVYLLLPLCMAEDGRCLVVREDFDVRVEAPRGR